ncbi:transaldolase family protein [Anaerococcus lactolyticus]|uniref:Transaldolase n=1 Tax=Anaerococcus lactolyticus S7-1-13 TaxID=1284686 RepID=A0A095YAI9_9FIRM|nr:transaldolase family protein [Anaerococcus lactolyticus]KGF03607.1 transaldolase [Anaerococcus lactolyticus S7-1-13]
MKLIIDDANIENIRKIYDYYPVSGVTTNPSILAKAGGNPLEHLIKIRQVIGEDELHVQVLEDRAEEIIREAEFLNEKLGANTYVKVPVNPEGLKAIKYLSKEGFKITATAIYSINQAYLAAEAGANYLAPYINRIDNLGYDGINIAKSIQKILNENKYETQILAASFKNSNQLIRLAEIGIGASTCSSDVIFKLIDDKNIDGAINDFKEDFSKLDPSKKTWLDFN